MVTQVWDVLRSFMSRDEEEKERQRQLESPSARQSPQPGPAPKVYTEKSFDKDSRDSLSDILIGKGTKQQFSRAGERIGNFAQDVGEGFISGYRDFAEPLGEVAALMSPEVQRIRREEEEQRIRQSDQWMARGKRALDSGNKQLAQEFFQAAQEINQRAAEGFSEEIDHYGQQQRRLMTGGAQTALSMVGAGSPRVLQTMAGSTVLGTSLSAAFGSENLGQDIGRSAQLGTQIAAFNRLTDPLIRTTMDKLPLIKGPVTERVGAGAANIGQGLAFDAVTGQPITPESIAFAAGGGALGGRRMFDAPVSNLMGGRHARGFGDAPQFSSRLDKQPRIEIDDSKAKIIENRPTHLRNTYYLDDVLEHPELFKQYPELKELRVKIGSNLYDDVSGFKGSYDPQANMIELPESSLKDPSTLLHEVQHAIQEFEGFARGGSPDLVDFLRRDVDPDEQYRRLSGEVESRSVQRRMDMPEDQRISTDPFAEEMIATTGRAEPSDFVTRFDDGMVAREARSVTPDITQFKNVDDFENALFGGKFTPEQMKNMGLEVDPGTRLMPGAFEFPKGIKNTTELFNQVKAQASTQQRVPYTPSKSLPDPDKQIESRFGEYLNQNYDTAVATYKQQFGKILNTDNARELSPDYVADKSRRSAAVHEPASAFIRALYTDELSRPDPMGRNEVQFTAGGTGAGKTTAIRGAHERLGIDVEPQIIYDTNLSGFKSSKLKVDQALDAGKRVEIDYVFRDPMDAMVNGAVPRALREGRTVPLDAHVDSHIGSLSTIRQLAQTYKNNDNVTVRVLDNSRGPNQARLVDLDSLNDIDYNKVELRGQLEAAIDSLYEQKRITPEVYEGFTGRQPPTRVTVEDLDVRTTQEAQRPSDAGRPQQPSGESGGGESVTIGADGKLHHKSPPKFEFDLKSLDTEDSVKETIRRMVESGLEGVQKQRRGTISWKQTRAMADALGMDFSDLEKRKIGKIWNAEEADAATRLALKVNEDLSGVSQQIRELANAGSEVPLDLRAQQAELIARARGVSAAIIGNRSETGRALNSAKMLKEALAENDPVRLQKQVLDMFDGDQRRADEVMTKLLQFDPDDTSSMARFLRQVKPSTILEKIEEYWYNSILSGPATHVVNQVSTGTATLMSLPERALAGVLDAGAEWGAKTLGKSYQRDRYAAEAAAAASGILTGMKKGIRRSAYVMRNGVREGDSTKLDFRRVEATKGKLGAVINLPTRMMAAEDEFMRGVVYEMDIRSQSYRTAKQEGLSGVKFQERVAQLMEEPTEVMAERAYDTTQRMLFQKNFDLSRRMTGIRDAAAIEVPKLGKFRPLRFVIPFIKTPTNIVAYGLERTPVGFAMAAHKGVTGKGKAEVIDTTAKALIGSSILAVLASYFTEDKITGPPPRDRKERDAFYADGMQPWSVRIGDNWVAFNRIEPFNSILSQLATYHEASRNGAETTPEKVGYVLRSMMRNVADQTWMTGVGNLMDAIEDPERYGSKFLTDITGGFIPSFAAAGARMMDDTVRAPEDATQSMMARLPMLSEQVPARESEFAEGGIAMRQQNEGAVRSVLSNVLGFRSTRAKDTDNLQQVRSIKQAERDSRGRRDEVKDAAGEFLDSFLTATPEESDALLQQAISEGLFTDEFVDSMQNHITAKLREDEFTNEQKIIQNYSHEAKARYMANRFTEMNDDEQMDWLVEMTSAGIITDRTLEYLIAILEEQLVQDPFDSIPLIQ